MNAYARAALVSVPSVEPISLADAKAHMRVTHSVEDSLITSNIAAARAKLERITHRAFLTQRWAVYLDCFPSASGAIWLPRAPAASVMSITYQDPDGVTQTLDSSVYELEQGAEPAAIWLAHDQEWPDVRAGVNCVTVTYTAGLDSQSEFQSREPDLVHAMRLLVEHAHRNRSAIIVGTIASNLPEGVHSLIAPRIIHGVPTFC